MICTCPGQIVWVAGPIPPVCAMHPTEGAAPGLRERLTVLMERERHILRRL